MAKYRNRAEERRERLNVIIAEANLPLPKYLPSHDIIEDPEALPQGLTEGQPNEQVVSLFLSLFSVHVIHSCLSFLLLEMSHTRKL